MNTMPTPISPIYNEAYWIGGAAEKTHVFVEANDLPHSLNTAPFTVAELGFGTGLNLLLTAKLAEHNGTPLTFISYELHPFAPDELARIHRDFPADLQPLSQVFLKHYAPQSGWNTLTFATTTLHLYIGDATHGIRTHPHPADAWFLDGFSPATNPDMWTPDLIAQVYAHTKTGGTASTYSVARATKDALTAAGFTFKRDKGFPPKWHMLKISKT